MATLTSPEPETIFFPGLLPEPFRHLSIVRYPPGHFGGPHVHDGYQLITVVAGKFRFSRPDYEPLELAPGDASVIGPGAPHSWETLGSRTCETFAVFFDPFDRAPFSELKTLFSRVPACDWWKLKLAKPLVRRAWQGVKEECSGLKPAGAIPALAHILLFMGTVERTARKVSALRVEKHPPALQRALDLIAANCADALSLAELARTACVSPRRLNQLFQEHLGCSAVRHLIGARLRMAKRLLIYSELTVGQIADRVGFQSIHHFSRLFKKHLGLNPSSFRRRPEPEHY